MQHIEWLKDNFDQTSSAQAGDAGDYYSYNYEDYYADDYNEEENDVFAGYVNAFGDYIIDDFYNEMDGTQWVVTNEYTTDLHDMWHADEDDYKQMDDMQVFSARSNGNNKNVETSAEQVLSSKCMLVFGRNV